MKAVPPFTVTVVGGGGYIGFQIGVAMLERGHAVTLFDISEPNSFWLDMTEMTELATDVGNTSSWSDGEMFYKKIQEASSRGNGSVLKLVRGSLLNTESLDKVISGADCVIHCASYGMSGKEQMPTQWSLTEQVNITGTENVLKACQIHGVRGFVYTSSFNVVFGGQKIVGGDESLPYFPLHQHVDHYSRTKAIAERLVLFADNLGNPKAPQQKSSSSPASLRTCALRLAGVMGLGEQRHLPRIISYFDYMVFRYGYGDNTLQQFSTIKNVVQAHVKAAEHLISHPDRLGGQAYFISDGIPINSFEFLRPLRESLGYEQPKVSVPMWLIWALVYFIQASHTLLSSIHPRLSFPPMLTPAEVYKTAVTHYFSSDKASRDFGYRAENPNDISDVIHYYRQKRKSEKKGLPTVFALVITSIWLLLLTSFVVYFYRTW